ncbi:E2-like conjugating enzyme atg10 [Phytophthora pseudosyringae]|uniref:Ubiquitin-like-conjugating enzyme ATG10 n=1 Tax=Phytophthora pseudosyringae TaxID=221518 RepID=A0A8T1VX48_9STRA|nr:E2-like conjugating enzyme atg10 [Phytophthora pseudosyringae]
MRNGSLSYERFCAEAELLQKRSHELARKQAVGTTRCVATWEWRYGNRQVGSVGKAVALWWCLTRACGAMLKHLDGNSYLVSTGNARQYHFEFGGDSEKVDEELIGDIDELRLAEEDNWLSDAEAQTTMLQSGDVKTALLEFHIVYHTIYQTPVLYFRALTVDGTPLPADTVTQDVQLPGSSGRSTVVAMEEHPVLGKPFSFLHPCETAAAMQLLQGQLQYSDRAVASLGVEVPHYLASWLSLVQPLTGLSPLDYYSV